MHSPFQPKMVYSIVITSLVGTLHPWAWTLILTLLWSLTWSNFTECYHKLANFNYHLAPENWYLESYYQELSRVLLKRHYFSWQVHCVKQTHHFITPGHQIVGSLGPFPSQHAGAWQLLYNVFEIPLSPVTPLTCPLLGWHLPSAGSGGYLKPFPFSAFQSCSFRSQTRVGSPQVMHRGLLLTLP